MTVSILNHAMFASFSVLKKKLFVSSVTCSKLSYENMNKMILLNESTQFHSTVRQALGAFIIPLENTLKHKQAV